MPSRSRLRRLLHADIPPQVPDQTFVSTLADLAASSTPTAARRARNAHAAAKLVAIAASVALLCLAAAHLAARTSDSPVTPTGPTGTVDSESPSPAPAVEPATGGTRQDDSRSSHAPALRPTTDADTAVSTPRPPDAARNRHTNEPTTEQPDRGVPPASPPDTAAATPPATDQPEKGTGSDSTVGQGSPAPTPDAGSDSHQRGEEIDTSTPAPTNDDVLSHQNPVRDNPPDDD